MLSGEVNHSDENIQQMHITQISRENQSSYSKKKQLVTFFSHPKEKIEDVKDVFEKANAATVVRLGRRLFLAFLRVGIHFGFGRGSRRRHLSLSV